MATLSSMPRRERAALVNIAIMRAFVGPHRPLATNEVLARKLAELEPRLDGTDQAIESVFDDIREMTAPPARPRREIGFHTVGKGATDSGATTSKRK